MSEDVCKHKWPLETQADPQRRQEVQLSTVQQVIWDNWSFEDPLPHSHWGETAQVHTMQLFSQSGFQSKRTHSETHWRETAQVQPMRLHYN